MNTKALVPAGNSRLQRINQQNFKTKAFSTVAPCLFVIVSGTGSFLYHGHKVDVRNGDMFLLLENQVISDISGPELEILALSFDKSFILSCQFELEIIPRNSSFFNTSIYKSAAWRIEQKRHLHHSLLSTVISLCQKIEEEQSSERKHVEVMCNAILLQLITVISRDIHEDDRDSKVKDLLMSKVIGYIHRSFRSRLTLDKLADYCGLSKSYFLKRFSRELAVPPLSYILKLRIREACDMLASTSLSIINISDQCGFKDSNYFTRCFKKLTGLPPRIYRKKYQKLPARQSVALFLGISEITFMASYYRDLLGGIFNAINHHQLDVNIIPVQHSFSDDEFSDIIDSHKYRGLIIPDWNNYFTDLPVSAFNNIQAVFFNEVPFYNNSSIVMLDNWQMGYDAGCFLLNNGHRSMACIQGVPATQVSKDRMQGFRTALKERGIKIKSEMSPYGYFLEEEGYNCAKRIFSGKNRPSALFCFNDVMAFGAYKAAEEAGLSIPANIAIIGCDDHPQGRRLKPPLTSYDHLPGRIGNTMVDVLIKRMNKQDTPNVVKIRGKLLKRRSV